MLKWHKFAANMYDQIRKKREMTHLSAKPLSALKPSRILSFLMAMFLTTTLTAGVWDSGDPVKGEQTFKANCAACHKITNEVLAGPGLAGIADRWTASEELLVLWIQNPQKAAESGDPYIKSLVERYVPVYGWMSAQAVSAADVADIMAYVQNPPGGGAAATTVAGNECQTYDEIYPEDKSSSASLWFLILLVLFIIIAASASSVKRSLTNAHRESEGKTPLAPQTYWESLRGWAWKNIVMVSIIGLFVVAYGAVVAYQTAMGVGTYQGYEPEQPIKFWHSIHVCENEVDCQYCHSSAADSKHAGIPSANVCMNCHKGIKNGSRWGEKELGKIYEAIGFNPETGQYIENYEEKPIKWNKVHNLPDHVYFNHSQHVTVAGLECQNCHGDVATYKGGRLTPVEDINRLVNDYPGLIELSKPTLTMGWCIECHNKASIDLASSGYYEEVHNRLKESIRGNEELRRYIEDESVTVKDLGGWECSKCHY
jgi:mono/diheme cytochrome c family protein